MLKHSQGGGECLKINDTWFNKCEKRPSAKYSWGKCSFFIPEEAEILETDGKDPSTQTAEPPPVPAAAQPHAGALEGGDGGAAVLPQRQVDHLHQVFVTKNAVLCSEVKKNFQVKLCFESKPQVYLLRSYPCK